MKTKRRNERKMYMDDDRNVFISRRLTNILSEHWQNILKGNLEVKEVSIETNPQRLSEKFELGTLNIIYMCDSSKAIHMEVFSFLSYYF